MAALLLASAGALATAVQAHNENELEVWNRPTSDAYEGDNGITNDARHCSKLRYDSTFEAIHPQLCREAENDVNTSPVPSLIFTGSDDTAVIEIDCQFDIHFPRKDMTFLTTHAIDKPGSSTAPYEQKVCEERVNSTEEKTSTEHRHVGVPIDPIDDCHRDCLAENGILEAGVDKGGLTDNDQDGSLTEHSTGNLTDRLLVKTNMIQGNSVLSDVNLRSTTEDDFHLEGTDDADEWVIKDPNGDDTLLDDGAEVKLDPGELYQTTNFNFTYTTTHDTDTSKFWIIDTRDGDPMSPELTDPGLEPWTWNFYTYG